jgi:hypothetical protein
VVAFDRKQVVRSVFLVDLAQGGLVGVQGVEHDELGLLFVGHMRGAASLGFAVNGNEFVIIECSSAQELILPTLEDTLEPPGIVSLAPR